MLQPDSYNLYKGESGLAMEPTYQKHIIIDYLYISIEITSTLTNS